MSNQLLELEKTLENQLVLVKEMRLIKSDVSKMKEEITKEQKFSQQLGRKHGI